MPYDMSNSNERDRAEMVIKRYDQLLSRRSPWESHWRQIAERIWPNANDFGGYETPGSQRTEHMYDAMPAKALKNFASVIEESVTPHHDRWHDMTTGYDHIDRERGMREFLEAYNQALFHHRYSTRANFIGQMHEIYMSLGCFGTGVLHVQQRPRRQGGGCIYRAIHIGQCVISVDEDGMVDTLYRCFRFSARAAARKWGEDCCETVKGLIRDSKLDDEVEFIHASYPREDWDPDRIDERGKRFHGTYVARADKEIVEESGSYEFPYIVPRYMTSCDEHYGRSPAMTMLPDVKQLFDMQRTIMTGAHFAVRPTVLTHDDDTSPFHLVPGAIARGMVSPEGRPLAHPFNTGGDIPLGLEMLDQKRNMIEEEFLGLIFRVLRENPQMTATQATLIARQHGQLVGPLVGRLQRELLYPMVRRESAILARQGLIPEMPDEIEELLSSVGGANMQFSSQVTRDQKLGDVIAAQRTMEQITPLAQVDPSVLSVFDMAKLAKMIAEGNGLPAEVIKDPEELEQQEEAQQQQQAASQLLEAAPVVSNSIRDLAHAQATATTGNTQPTETPRYLV